MVICEICGQEFKNNLGGDLTKHLRNEHNVSIEDYYVLTELNGIEPKCQCGLCDKRPNFRRGKFSKYAIGHEKFEWQQKQYIDLYGQPKCQNPDCDNVVSFYRGKPRKYCCHKCSEIAEPCHWNQDKVNSTVKEKYCVENVFQLGSVKIKSIETMMNNWGVEHALQSAEIYEKMIKKNIKKHGIKFPQSLPEAKAKKKETTFKNHGVIHYSKTKNFREQASKNMCKYNKNVNTNHKIRYYKETKLYYQSMHEYRFLEYCEVNNLLQFINNSPTFKYLDFSFGKWHLPDFKFKENFIIEIKSSYWLKRQGGWDKLKAKQLSVESKNYQYILILDENYDIFFEKCL